MTKASRSRGGSGSLAALVEEARQKVAEGTALWKAQKRADCFDMYKGFCVKAEKQCKLGALKGPLTQVSV